MNYLWAGMILIGIIFGAFNGRMEVITNAALDSSKEAVTLCITMIGIMSFWCGIMEIAAQAGIIGSAAKKMRPVIRFLFPDLPKEHKAQEHITTNFIANILGLGWAATPAGLKAMKELETLEEERRAGKAPGPVRRKGVASNEMCTFLIVNISSLQLIPINMIAYRSQYGSVSPSAIVGPALAATAVSPLTGVAYGGCSHILQNSGAKAKEIWYNQGEQISGKEQEICIKNSMCKIVSAADSTGV